MIVLDEQLLGHGIEDEIAKWYPGSVRFILDLRPHSIIKDDAVAQLLNEEDRPTFVTINERDFWMRIPISRRFGVVCFALPDERAQEIPAALRALLGLPEFRTKAKRAGKVIRVTHEEISYYSSDDRQVRKLNWQPGK
jgi:hypothetical protein